MLNENNLQEDLEHPTQGFDEIRQILLGKSSDEISRELPGLIETVQTQSLGKDDTKRYLIGISFSKRGTCFDYFIDRVIDVDHQENHNVEVIKEPVSSEHQYITFQYPPDQAFDGAALRGVLLSTIEREVEDQSHEEKGSQSANSGISYLIKTVLDKISGG